MNNLHPIMAAALAPFAPPPLTEAEAQAIDQALLRDKQTFGYERRNQLAALKAQIQANPEHWGSACGMLNILRGAV